jgi:hypothetical protein
MSKIAAFLLMLGALALSAPTPARAGAGLQRPATRIGPIEKRPRQTHLPVCSQRPRIVGRSRAMR